MIDAFSHLAYTLITRTKNKYCPTKLHERNTEAKCELMNKDAQVNKQIKRPCKDMKYLVSKNCYHMRFT